MNKKIKNTIAAAAAGIFTLATPAMAGPYEDALEAFRPFRNQRFASTPSRDLEERVDVLRRTIPQVISEDRNPEHVRNANEMNNWLIHAENYFGTIAETIKSAYPTANSKVEFAAEIGRQGMAPERNLLRSHADSLALAVAYSSRSSPQVNEWRELRDKIVFYNNGGSEIADMVFEQASLERLLDSSDSYGRAFPLLNGRSAEQFSMDLVCDQRSNERQLELLRAGIERVKKERDEVASWLSRAQLTTDERREAQRYLHETNVFLEDRSAALSASEEKTNELLRLASSAAALKAAIENAPDDDFERFAASYFSFRETINENIDILRARYGRCPEAETIIRDFTELAFLLDEKKIVAVLSESERRLAAITRKIESTFANGNQFEADGHYDSAIASFREGQSLTEEISELERLLSIDSQTAQSARAIVQSVRVPDFSEAVANTTRLRSRYLEAKNTYERATSANGRNAYIEDSIPLRNFEASLATLEQLSPVEERSKWTDVRHELDQYINLGFATNELAAGRTREAYKRLNESRKWLVNHGVNIATMPRDYLERERRITDAFFSELSEKRRRAEESLAGNNIALAFVEALSIRDDYESIIDGRYIVAQDERSASDVLLETIYNRHSARFNEQLDVIGRRNPELKTRLQRLYEENRARYTR